MRANHLSSMVFLVLVIGCTKPASEDSTKTSEPKSSRQSTEVERPAPIKQPDPYIETPPTMETVAGELIMERPPLPSALSVGLQPQIYTLLKNGTWSTATVFGASSGTWRLADRKFTMLTTRRSNGLFGETKKADPPEAYCEDSVCKFDQDGRLKSCSEIGKDGKEYTLFYFRYVNPPKKRDK